MRPLELALLTWSLKHHPELNDEWMCAKCRQDQARAIATMFRAACDSDLRWLMWSANHHMSDLAALMPYVGPLQQVPSTMNLAQYMKALNDTDAFST